MDSREIAIQRLIRQQIAGTSFTRPQEIVRWMGAMQAQDYAMAKWAVGARLPGSTEQAVEDALNSGKILRTHLLRPTWHLVAATDIRWIINLTAPGILASLRSRHRQLELTDSVIRKSNAVIERALQSGETLTRKELFERLEQERIATRDQRGVHLLLRAELDGIICSGTRRGNEQTYALLNERVPKKKILPREEAAAELAKRYFTSRGPATIRDFVWWSGVSVADAKRAVENLRPRLDVEQVDEQTYFAGVASYDRSTTAESVFVLPSYDEFLIAYADRSAMLTAPDQKKVVSNNGIFWPVIVAGGKVAGRWNRKWAKGKLHIGLELFEPLNKNTRQLLPKALEHFKSFVGKNSGTTSPLQY